MLIRINLLAEQIEADEARRRDPIKRAIFIGSSVVITLLLFSASLQYRLTQLRRELAAVQAEVLDIEPQAKGVRTDLQRIGEVEGRQKSLRRYSANRFFWATALDALQRTTVDGVRVISLASSQHYSTNAESRFRTNFIYAKPVQSKWRFWSKPPVVNFHGALSNQLGMITSRPEYMTNRIPAKTQVVWTSNPLREVAAVDIVRPVAAAEKVQLTIDARDYSEIPGQRVDEFLRLVAASPYFKDRLQKGEGRGLRLKSRGIRPEVDPQDGENSKPFIPFTIECNYEESIRAHE